MKKVLALLILALATLPSLAADQRIWPQYRIGAAELQNNDGRLTVSQQAQNGEAYVTDFSPSLTTCTVAVASIPAGQQFTRWWYYYLTGARAATTNETALGTATTCTWTYDTKIATAGVTGVYVVADFDYLTYTLHYNANGGSGSMPDESHIYTNRFNLAANAFTRTGYTFGGWTNKTGTAFANQKQITSGAAFGVTYTNKTATLFAKWTANKYTVTLNQQNGSGGTSSVTATYGAAMPSITLPTRTGYTFGGYFTGTNGTGTQYYTAAGKSARAWDKTDATTLYAKWTAKTCTVTFDQQSGTGGSTSVTATYGSAMPTATMPTRTGYTFGGYFTETDGGGTQYYNASGASAKAWDIASATTLYAHWTANTYTVTLDRQSGSGGTSSVTATYNAAMLTISKPTRTGYTFGGYYDQANGGGTQYYTAAGASARNWNKTAATTLYAKWTANTYSVHFNANGGSGTMASQSFTYDVAQALAANAYARDGYVFGGWTNSTGTAYADVASVSNLASANGAVVDLYAKWTHLWTVVFMDDSLFDSEVISSKAYPNGTSIIQPSAPSHTGYTFKGWAPSVSQTAVADAAYVAQYEANKYRVTFHSNYGDDVTNGTMRFTYGESFSIPASISGLTSREGYVLEGWGTTADAETPQYAPAATGVLFEDASAVDLYAVWKPIAYTIVFDGAGAEAGSVDDIAAVYDRAYALPANGFARSGFNFTGWRFGNATYAVGASVSNLTTTANAIVTFSAVWSELRYAAFDGHGADNAEAMIDDVLTFDGIETHALVSNKFEKTGYTFAGWATNETEAAAQTVAYTDGADVASTNLWNGIGETNVFSAVWQTNAYTVVFSANGGTGEMAPQAFVYDQPQALAPRVFTSSLEFRGWATNETGEVVFADRAVVSNLTAEANGTVTLSAVWDNGELSQAMHCRNLVWVQKGAGAEWTIVKGADEGYNSSGSSVASSVSWNGSTRSQTLAPREGTTGSGTLSFWYKATRTGIDPYWFYFESDGQGSTNLNLQTNWTKFGPVDVADLSTVAIYLALDTEEGDDCTVWIDQMTWVPAGAEPTEADRPVVSGFTPATDGGFTLSVDPSNVSDSFSYQILATNELVGGEWPVKAKLTADELKAGYAITPEADAPTMFYKVKVIAK